MRPRRLFVWIANLLLFATLVTTLPHAHPSGPLHDRQCFACIHSHTPVVQAGAAPLPAAPRPTGDRPAETALATVVDPLVILPSTRAPPSA